MSYLLPFTSAIPVDLSRDIDLSSSHQSIPRRSRNHNKSYSRYHEAGVEVILRTPQPKGNWINGSRNNPERRQNCRRVNSQRDWSRELEESEYRLPFPVASEETERGGGSRRRTISFRDEIVLPRLDNAFTNMGQGLMIDMEERMTSSSPVEMMERDDAEGSAVGTESSGNESLETDISATDSEWTAFSAEAEGIEMLF